MIDGEYSLKSAYQVVMQRLSSYGVLLGRCNKIETLFVFVELIVIGSWFFFKKNLSLMWAKYKNFLRIIY